jgi:hypothetical protein
VLPKPLRCTYVRGLGKINYLLQSGYIVGTYIISDCVERQSRDEKKHIITKDVVSLLLGEQRNLVLKYESECDSIRIGVKI